MSLAFEIFSVKFKQLTPEITCPIKYESVETYVPLNKFLRENPATRRKLNSLFLLHVDWLQSPVTKYIFL